MHLSTLRKNSFALANKRYIRHQTARVIVVNSVLFYFFLPFPVRWQRPRVKFAALPPSPTWWSPSRETRLTTNCLPHVGGPHHYAKHLWKDGTLCLEGGFGARWDTTTPGGSEARVLAAPPTSETARWGNHFCFRYQETKLLNFLDMLGGVGGAFVRWKPLFQLLGGKNSNSHRS